MSSTCKPYPRLIQALEGKRIVKVDSMSSKETDYWGIECVVLELDDGQRWMIMQDEEGNGGGALDSTGFVRKGTKLVNTNK